MTMNFAMQWRECPKCGKVRAPTVQSCVCNTKQIHIKKHKISSWCGGSVCLKIFDTAECEECWRISPEHIQAISEFLDSKE